MNGITSNTNTTMMAMLPFGLTEEECATALDYAKLSSLTYNMTSNFAVLFALLFVSGIDDVKNQDFTVNNYKKINQGGNGIDWLDLGAYQGLDYTVFQHMTSGDVVLAFRGTEPLSWKDWVQDIKQAVGSSGGSEQYHAAIQLARTLQNQTESHHVKLSFTGHSLGGGLATAAALATGCPAIGFCAAGLSESTVAAHNLKLANAVNIMHFNVQGDFLSDHNGKMDNTTFDANGILEPQKQYGDIYWLTNVNDRPNVFLGLLDRWLERFLNHTWQVFTYQLEHKNFLFPAPAQLRARL